MKGIRIGRHYDQKNNKYYQKTKLVKEKSREIDRIRFKIQYVEKVKYKIGVGIVVHKNFKKNVVDLKRLGDSSKICLQNNILDV